MSKVADRHRHVWRFAVYRVGRTTTGVSGRGRTIPHRRECTCGVREHRVYDGRTSRWVSTADANTLLDGPVKEA